MFDPTKPGWQTTEALLVVAVLALGNTVFHHQLDREKVLGTINLVAPVAYVASRTLVKVTALWRGAVPAVTPPPTVTVPHPPPVLDAPHLTDDELPPFQGPAAAATSAKKPLDATPKTVAKPRRNQR